METSKYSVVTALNLNAKLIFSSKMFTKIKVQFHFLAKIHYLEGKMLLDGAKY